MTDTELNHLREYLQLKAQYVHPVTRQKIHVGTYDNAYQAHCQALAHRLENHWIVQ